MCSYRESVWVHMWDLKFCIYIALTLYGTADYPGAPVQVVRRRWENLAGIYRVCSSSKQGIYSHSFRSTKLSNLPSEKVHSVLFHCPSVSVVGYSLPFSFCPFQSSPFVCQHLRRVILVIADALWLTLQGSLCKLSFPFCSRPPSLFYVFFFFFCGEKGNFPILITSLSVSGEPKSEYDFPVHWSFQTQTLIKSEQIRGSH